MTVCAISRKRLNFAIARGKHLARLHEAARDFGCIVAVVPQGPDPFDPPPAEPGVILIKSPHKEEKGYA